LLNPDAFVEPNWLESLCLQRSESNFDVFGSKLLNASDPTKLDGAGDAYHISGLVWRMGHGMQIRMLMRTKKKCSPLVPLQRFTSAVPCLRSWF